MYTFGRSFASYSFKTDNACSGVLCADAIRSTVSNLYCLQASDIFVQCSISALETIKKTTNGFDIMGSLLPSSNSRLISAQRDIHPLRTFYLLAIRKW